MVKSMVEIYKNFANVYPHPTAVTIGNFDGVHLGHQKIIEELVNVSRARELLPLAMTFDPHPIEVLRGKPVKKLMTVDQRVSGLKSLGASEVICLRFDQVLSQVTAESFVETLVSKLNMKMLVLGEGAHFGKDRRGNAAFLKSYLHAKDTDLLVVPSCEFEGVTVSSSLIRDTLEKGDVSLAASFLGRFYETQGLCHSGIAVGRQIGFPTLNMIDPTNMSPGRGVYVSETFVEGAWYPSVSNVGIRPTVHQDSSLTIESHLLHIDVRSHVSNFSIRWFKRLRDEKKFTSIDDLRRQIELDVREADVYFRDKNRQKQSY